jgi:hypothetical protein
MIVLLGTVNGQFFPFFSGDAVADVGGDLPYRLVRRSGGGLIRGWGHCLALVFEPLQQQGRGFGHRGIDRREMPAMDGGLYRAFKLGR